MTMNRRDYQAIAEGFKIARPDPEIAHPDVVTAWEMSVLQVANKLGDRNSSFDFDKFYAACCIDLDT